MAIQTAAQHVATITKQQQALAKEKREFRQKQNELERYEDLRDDVMSAVKNSGVSFADIHGRCGPTPATLNNWAEKKVFQPRLGKIRATLRVIGKDIGIVELAPSNPQAPLQLTGPKSKTSTKPKAPKGQKVVKGVKIIGVQVIE